MAARELELNLGHFCNNRCLFCVSGQLTERGLAIHAPFEALVDALRGAAAAGTRKVTLLGGEPTLHPRFLDLLDEIVAAGIPDVVLFTNGARAGDIGFLQEVCRRGRFTWRFSIQGGNAARHDHTTQRRGAFDRIARGLGTLHAAGQHVTVNMCVNGENLPDLEDLPPLLGRCGVASFHADMVRPHSVGDRSADELDALVAPYPVVAAALRRMLASFDAHAPAVDVRIGNLPFCALPDHAHRIVHGGPPTETRTADSAGRPLSAGVDKYAYQAEERVFPPACEGCGWRNRCVGLPTAYYARHGDAGVGAAALASRPPSDSPRPRAAPDPAPTPASHHAGTLALLNALSRLAGAGPLDTRIQALLGDPAALPTTGDGLKYDAYLTSAPGGLAWGFTVNTRWEGAAALPRFAAFVDSFGVPYAWDRVAPLWEALGGVLTLGVGFDRPGAPPRLKLYAQEDTWGAGVAYRGRVEALVQRPLPDWVGPRIGVVTLQLHPGGGTSWKLYRGAASPLAAADGAPAEVAELARQMHARSPLGPAWYYVTIRLDDPPRYALNKIYGYGAWRAPGQASRPWRDVGSLFSSAGRGAAFEALLREVVALRGVKVLPTASALEDAGRSADVYCAAWRGGT